jgi:hypothetical protein
MHNLHVQDGYIKKTLAACGANECFEFVAEFLKSAFQPEELA